jgi:hypothetical protein
LYPAKIVRKEGLFKTLIFLLVYPAIFGVGALFFELTRFLFNLLFPAVSCYYRVTSLFTDCVGIEKIGVGIIIIINSAILIYLVSYLNKLEESSINK